MQPVCFNVVWGVETCAVSGDPGRWKPSPDPSLPPAQSAITPQPGFQCDPAQTHSSIHAVHPPRAHPSQTSCPRKHSVNIQVGLHALSPPPDDCRLLLSRRPRALRPIAHCSSDERVPFPVSRPKSNSPIFIAPPRHSTGVLDGPHRTIAPPLRRSSKREHCCHPQLLHALHLQSSEQEGARETERSRGRQMRLAGGTHQHPRRPLPAAAAAACARSSSRSFPFAWAGGISPPAQQPQPATTSSDNGSLPNAPLTSHEGQTGDGTTQPSFKVNYKVLVPSVTIISLLVLVTAIGAMILLVRASRIRTRNRAERADLEEGKRGDASFGHHRKSAKGPQAPKPTLARRSADKVLKALHWNDLSSIREKLRNSLRSTEEKTAPRAVEKRDVRSVERGLANHPRASHGSYTRRLHMREVGTGSLRKLEHLTGSIVIPTPQLSEQLTPNAPHTSRSFATDGGATHVTQSSTDTYARRHTHHSIGDVIHPLTAPPKPPPKSPTYPTELSEGSFKPSGTRSKRVSFTQGMTQHIASQYSQTSSRRMSFPQPRVFNQPLPPTPVVVHGGNDEPEYSANKRRRPSAPPPLLIVQSGSSGSRSGRRAERTKRHSWSGRSVLDLEDSSPTGSDSPPRQSVRIPRSNYQSRKPVPPAKRAYAALPVSSASAALRLPLQELSRSGFSNHGSNARMPQVDFAPRIRSMIVETVHGPEAASPSSVSTFDAAISGRDKPYRETCSPELGGLSPPPSRPITASTGSSTSLKVPEKVPPVPVPQKRQSISAQSTADTVMSEESSGTNLTEGELVMEMQMIKERARRASIERKARRAERERREIERAERAERAEQASSKDKGKGKAKDGDE
ncbi:hypothetical protein DFH27DRAFT_600535 [Peziza echinospora]|nr:hypothetical protein DFH27DRAFT_600535 [Peziza echinospora]